MKYRSAVGLLTKLCESIDPIAQTTIPTCFVFRRILRQLSLLPLCFGLCDLKALIYFFSSEHSNRQIGLLLYKTQNCDTRCSRYATWVAAPPNTHSITGRILLQPPDRTNSTMSGFQCQWRACRAIPASNVMARNCQQSFLIRPAQPKQPRGGSSRRQC